MSFTLTFTFTSFHCSLPFQKCPPLEQVPRQAKVVGVAEAEVELMVNDAVSHTKPTGPTDRLLSLHLSSARVKLHLYRLPFLLRAVQGVQTTEMMTSLSKSSWPLTSTRKEQLAVHTTLRARTDYCAWKRSMVEGQRLLRNVSLQLRACLYVDNL